MRGYHKVDVKRNGKCQGGLDPDHWGNPLEMHSINKDICVNVSGIKGGKFI